MYDTDEQSLEEALTNLIKLGLLQVEVDENLEVCFKPTDVAYDLQPYLVA